MMWRMCEPPNGESVNRRREREVVLVGRSAGILQVLTTEGNVQVALFRMKNFSA